MGIHGIFKEIGPGQRISLAKFSADHFVTHQRPLRLAIDISIWLFQIQAGKGGSNPALRTFYYRLLRLLTLNIHPLFVFDGPSKPLFKRNKKVGGPGVRVASVPEFLAKQLLKQFGFPWHVAPGEAEAECALLQRETIVDAVLSEDVDTLMFGSGVTLRNWSAENSSKTPTHVNVYRALETKGMSGLDREGMILVALMSGGDYITEGIPGCGPKLACDAARAGYGRGLCAIRKKDTAGFATWRENLQHQIRTNEQKIFSRKNAKVTIPDNFPDIEVLGYYTQPCVSTSEKLANLREVLKWDQKIDFPALRSFTADAFDWRCLGGAKKFIRNLAPAMLVRELRLCGGRALQLSDEAQEQQEQQYVCAIHGKRNHSTTDGELEYRISFIPMNLVPIDLSMEDDDDNFIPAGSAQDPSDSGSEFAALPSSTAGDDEPSSPTKKRAAKPYEPEQAEKLWMMLSFLRVGCPMLVEGYENNLKAPKECPKQKQKARAATSTADNTHTRKPTKKNAVKSQAGDILLYGKITKLSQAPRSKPASLHQVDGPFENNYVAPKATSRKAKFANTTKDAGVNQVLHEFPAFKLPTTQIPFSLLGGAHSSSEEDEETPKANQNPATWAATPLPLTPSMMKNASQTGRQRTPRGHKRPPEGVISPAMSQRTIDSYWSPSPKEPRDRPLEIIDLVSSSPPKVDRTRPLTPSPPCLRHCFVGDTGAEDLRCRDLSPRNLPDSVTKRRKKAALRRSKTAPLNGMDENKQAPSPALQSCIPEVAKTNSVEAMDLTIPSPTRYAVMGATNLFEDAVPVPAVNKNLRIASRKYLRNAGQPSMDTFSLHGMEKGWTSKVKVIPFSTSDTLPLPSRCSPRQQQPKKKRIQLRESLAGAWRECEIEELDLSGDASGSEHSQGRAKLPSWRRSGVEVLDLTGA